MKKTDDEIETGRPGLIRALWDWMTGRTPPAAAAEPPDEPDPELSRAALDELAVATRIRNCRAGMPMCERCGSRRGEDDSTMHRRWCESCDLTWIEEEICYPLVARMGRRKARELLKACVRGELRLSDRKCAL